MYKNILLLILAISLVFLTSKIINRSGSGNTYNDTIVHSDTIVYVDTIEYRVDTVIPIYKVITDSIKIYNIIDSLHIDTSFIIDNYFCRNYYNDTLRDDSLLTIILKENTYMNLIEDRSLFIVRRNPVITNIIKLNERFKWKWYIGGFISGTDNYLDAGPSMQVIPNKRWIVGGSYGIRHKSIGINLGYRIK